MLHMIGDEARKDAERTWGEEFAAVSAAGSTQPPLLLFVHPGEAAGDKECRGCKEGESAGPPGEAMGPF